MAVKDKRFRFTEQLIRDIFKQMLKTMPPEKITVAELCRRAGINRGTFYLHYKDCYELLEILGAELANELSRSMDGMFENESSLQAKVLQILSALYSDDGIGYILFAHDRSRCFEILSLQAKERTIANWRERSALTYRQAELIYAYISGGCYALAKQIGSGELNADESEVYEIMFELISFGLSAFVVGLNYRKKE